MENSEHKLKLHAVIIKKPCELSEAKAEAREYIPNPKNNFYRETKSSYRFRAIPKTKFIRGGFKTKKINKNTSLIFGILKPEFEHLEGAGFFDFIKKPFQAVKTFFAPRVGYNNVSTKNLNEWGNLPIVRLMIARTPILNVLDKAINLISFGKWGQLKKEYSFDKLFHLQLIANLGNKNLVIEKNEVININTNFSQSANTETLDVELGDKKFTVNEMLNKTQQRLGDKLYFSYDGFTNNCQNYIKECLISEDLYSEKAKDFLFQDVSELAKKMPAYSKTIMNALTTTGAIANKLMGKGEEMPLGKEFEMDTKDHNKKLTKFEKESHDNETIEEVLEGLKTLSSSSLAHIEKIESMLKKEGGSAKSAGFIRAIMAGKNKEHEGQFKKFNKDGFDELKLNQASENVIKNNFKDKSYKDFVLLFSYPASNGLYNIAKTKEIYLNDKTKANQALEQVEELIFNEGNFMSGLKKLFPNYDELDEEDKELYKQKYRQAIISTILSKYYDGMKPIKNAITQEMENRIKASYIAWRQKASMTKKNKSKNEAFLKQIENMKEGEELELPMGDKEKPDEAKIKKEMKDNKPKKMKKSEFMASKERSEINDALTEYLKKKGNGKIGAGFWSHPGDFIFKSLGNLGKKAISGTINTFNKMANDEVEKEGVYKERNRQANQNSGGIDSVTGLPKSEPRY